MMRPQTDAPARESRRRRYLAVGLALVLGACAPRTTAPVPAEPSPEDEVVMDGVIPIIPGDYVSRSRGEPGGVVLLWPRVIPAADAPTHTALAASVQARLRVLLGEVLPGRNIDVRPEGERVCIKTGCVASSVGVLLLVRNGQCVAVVSATAPGKSEHVLVPWAGDVTHDARVPFRQPLESHVKVRDMIPCAELASHAAGRDAEVKAALAALP